MILPLFLALLALSVVIVWLGYYTNDEPYLPVGLFFFFLLGLVILQGQLEYQTGETKLITPTYGGGGELTSQTEVTTYTWVAWDDNVSHWIGWTFSILSVCGFGLSLFNMRKGRGDEYID